MDRSNYRKVQLVAYDQVGSELRVAMSKPCSRAVMFMTQPDLLFGWYYPTLDPLMEKTKPKLRPNKKRKSSLIHLDGKG